MFGDSVFEFLYRDKVKELEALRREFRLLQADYNRLWEEKQALKRETQHGQNR